MDPNPAIYGFENDEIDTTPQGWEDTSQTYTCVKVISGIEGCNKTLECYSGSETESVLGLWNEYEPQINELYKELIRK